MTGKEMCEAILKHRDPSLEGDALTRAAEQLWAASPSGELVHVFGAYQDMRLEQVANGSAEEDPLPDNAAVGDLAIRKMGSGAAVMVMTDQWRVQVLWSPAQFR
jgi:hypothetical protein